MGQPLINNTPAHNDNWKLPKYNQVFTSILTGDDKVPQVKAKRPKPCCFNCGSEHHQLKDCPKPRDLAKIGQSRREFLIHSGENFRSSGPQVRYHVENSQVFEHFKPGIYSSDLQEALGMIENHLPPFIYRMRQLGYPPGWLREAETESSGLTIHDSEVGLSDGDINNDCDKIPHDQRVTYDLGKVVDFPGFNTPPHPNTRDEWKSYGSVPMLSQHSKESLLVTLSAKSQKVVRIKRQHVVLEPEGPNPNKHRRAWNENRRESDMEIDSGTDTSDQTPQHLPEYDLHWKPPLPPPPQHQTPPPLPSDTPPSNSPVPSQPAYPFNPPLPPTSTPPPLPKETPPPSPFNCSQGSSPVQPPEVQVLDEQIDAESLTLEDLEEHERIIRAALLQSEGSDGSSSPAPLSVSSHLESGSNSVSLMGACETCDNFPCEDDKTPGRDLEPLATTKEDVDEKNKETVVVDVKVVDENSLLENVGQCKQGESERKSPENEQNWQPVANHTPENQLPLSKPSGELESPASPTNPYDRGLASTTKSVGGPEIETADQTLENAGPPAASSPSSASSLPHWSRFAEGVMPFQATPSAAPTGVYQRLRSVLLRSSRHRGKQL
uniref:Zinc finger CCHC domain-containing protein 8 n=1 Tax=Eptatretus burgeri TaxID=7764 RepID=A0A8C4QAV4_EPTBU